MAEVTDIAWTDSTFNPWWGCTKVSAGCDHCYAEELDTRTGGSFWGARNKPRVMSADNWRKPRRWEREHAEFEAAHGHRHRVFCASMADWADKNAPEGQRDRLWTLIRETPSLDWQLLTKRAPNIRKYLPKDWGDGYQNVWLGVTVDNRKQGLPRIEFLRNVKAAVRFLSVEPLLEDLGPLDLELIHWVIVGGESGPGCRPMDMSWVENIRRQCAEQGVAFFYKQRGGHPNKSECEIEGREVKEWPVNFCLNT